MTEAHSDSFLPQVDDSDLSVAWFDDIINPSHRERFDRLAAQNPVLARELLKRAYVDSGTLTGASSYEINTAIIDSVTFIISALEAAIKREKSNLPSDGGVASGLPRLSEPGDGQSAE